MAVNTYWYGLAKQNMAKKLIDWEDDTIMVSLHTTEFIPDQDADEFQDDLSYESSATGYTAGGNEIANTTLNYTGGTNTLMYDGNNVVWTITGTITFQYAVIYDATPGNAGTNPLIGFIDFGSEQTVTDGTLTFNFSTDGIFQDVVVAPS